VIDPFSVAVEVDNDEAAEVVTTGELLTVKRVFSDEVEMLPKESAETTTKKYWVEAESPVRPRECEVMREADEVLKVYVPEERPYETLEVAASSVVQVTVAVAMAVEEAMEDMTGPTVSVVVKVRSVEVALFPDASVDDTRK
jgi:hypothetical protein